MKDDGVTRETRCRGRSPRPTDREGRARTGVGGAHSTDEGGGVGGWQRYFSYGTVSRAYWNLDKFLLYRARIFLARRHKLPRRGTRRFTAERVFEQDGLFHLGAAERAARSHALM